MKTLAISIPNYNRIFELKRLLFTIIEQIEKFDLFNDVQICICDDCSPDNPSKTIEEYINKYSQIDIRYYRKETNQGMSRNFLDSVLMAESEYCWIIGNDDMPEDDAIYEVVKMVKSDKKVDYIVTPFDVYEREKYSHTIFPINNKSVKIYDTSKESEYRNLCLDILHNAGIFGFLSNIVFRKRLWEEEKNSFIDKINTLFIQMYINIRSLQKGVIYKYINQKIIRNYQDNETNNTLKRIAGVLFGLDEVVEYFFKNDLKDHFKTILTDPFINGALWETEGDYKERIKKIDSVKNNYYKKYYVSPRERTNLFSKNLIIYGCGKYGYTVYKEAIKANANIISVLDSDIKKIGQEFGNHHISYIEEITKYYNEDNTMVIVANHHNLVEMIEKIHQYGIGNIAIIT